MRIIVVSDDEFLPSLCKHTLASCSRFPLSELIVLDPGKFLVEPTNPCPEADVYIWDLLPEHGVAPWIGCDSRSHHLLLVDRNRLADFEPPMAGMVLIQKPVTEAVLNHWLGVFSGNTATKSIVPIEEGRERQWSDFLTRAVHDFRAPLTAATGYCGLLLAGEMGPLTDRQKVILDRTQNSLVRLARMTTEILHRAAKSQVDQSSQSEAGAGSRPVDETPGARGVPMRKPRMEQAEIDGCIAQAIHEIRLRAAERNIWVKAEVVPPTQPLYFDSGHLEEVLANLLENAIKFTPVGGRIEISGYPYGSKLYRVDVFNTGPHISTRLLEQVFEEYASFEASAGAPGSYSGSAERVTPSGVGLGLAISRSIIEGHEGRIWIENQAEGPCISFVLPIEHKAGSLIGSSKINERYETNGTR